MSQLSLSLDRAPHPSLPLSTSNLSCETLCRSSVVVLHEDREQVARELVELQLHLKRLAVASPIKVFY